MANLKNVWCRVRLRTSVGPSLTAYTIVVIPSATSLADANTQAIALTPGALGSHASLPVVLGTSY
jgi:hypothetical protein